MQLGTQPRIRLGNLPTPLEEAPRLREALGGVEWCPRILIKRDDLTGLAFGGNKVRKLEYLVADALARRATVLITCRRGAVEPRAPDRRGRACGRTEGCAGARHSRGAPGGAGATYCSTGCSALRRDSCRPAPTWTRRWPMSRASSKPSGERPYVITGGGSNAIGALGYVAATLELAEQTVQIGVAPIAALLRQRLARHASGAGARREALAGTVGGAGDRGQRRRAGEDPPRGADRGRSGAR